MPEVSIIMPVRNAEALVGQSIESVLNGTFQDWELLVVDEGSTDETAAVVKAYAADEHRVRYLRREESGTAKAINAALARIPLERPYLAFLESGYFWSPEKLDTQLGSLRESGAGAVFCATEGEIQQGITMFEGESGVPAMLGRANIAISSILCNSASMQTLGDLDETPARQGLEGYGMMLKFLQKGYLVQSFPEKMVRIAEELTVPERDALSEIRRKIAVLSSFRFSDETAGNATRRRILELYRMQIDMMAIAKDKKGIRATLPALNAFLGNPRIGSALANMLFLPSGLYRKFAQWLLSSLMK